MTKPIVVGVAGGTGSGKTTIVRALARELGPRTVAILQHDSYYRDHGALPPADRESINYDHPNALDTGLLVEHLTELCHGHDVHVPIYDFVTHSRSFETTRVEPAPVIVVDGILVFVDEALRSLFDLRIFVETDDDVRFIRRLERDTTERGRTRESVVRQYLTSVRPMHVHFVQPSRQFAHLIVPEGGHNHVATEAILGAVRNLLAARGHQPAGELARV